MGRPSDLHSDYFPGVDQLDLNHLGPGRLAPVRLAPVLLDPGQFVLAQVDSAVADFALADSAPVAHLHCPIVQSFHLGALTTRLH